MAAARGWNTLEAVRLDAAQKPAASFEANRTTVFQTAYIDANGQVSDDTPADKVLTVHMIAQFRQPPTSSDLDALKSRFSSAVTSVGAAL